ncbi:MAG TPA: TadE/TadG family type IV pilus assembly protein, partial [Dehalococcoidia bacterium]|nr:TadE/TadG family type IV pilus assembly protein [Dehalococcoidia bacterium]
RRQLRDQRGQVVVLFALLLPVLFALGAVVIAIGNWFTHAKHLQTKADAGAFAGGNAWAFPCGPQIDARIEAGARTYSGALNPQVGGVPSTSIHSVLNGNDWYDDDSNNAPAEFVNPAGPVCQTMTLDVKVTEDNSFPLASLMPFFPDIKRKARVEIQEAAGVTGLLPIAVRAPEPVSAAAVFYNEANGAVLRVRYLVKEPAIPGLPAALQGWTTYNTEDPNRWADISGLPSETGVLIAISFRGACNTGLPVGNTKIKTSPQPNCFEDNFGTVSALCNQGSATQIVNCYYASGNWPSESVQAGLHFIRGYGTGTVGVGQPPQLRSAWLENTTCSVNGTPAGYFNAHPNSACEARLRAVIDLGSADPDGNGPLPVTDRSANNAEVRYRIVNDTGDYSGNVCTAFTTTVCDLNGSGAGANTSWVTQQRLPRFNANTRRNSIIMRIRLRNTRVGNTQCPQTNYSATCEFFFTSQGTLGNAPNDATALADPVQRMFRGNSLTSSSVQWIRLTTDSNCSEPYEWQDTEAASQISNGTRCFYVDVGLKGGAARDADEPAVFFNDGTGPSQMGALDCDPAIQQGQEMTIGIVRGCNLWYDVHPFDWNPLCPQQNQLFTTPNPGAPWNDGRWPPLRCVKTRPGNMNQLDRGFNERLYGNPNQNSCPPDQNRYVRGRNYWKAGTNMDTRWGYKDDNPVRDTRFSPEDKRLVTIFLTTTEAFTGSGQATFPITGFIEIYVTGYGRIGGNGQLSPQDPCGTAPPTDLDLSGGVTNGTVVWGHILKHKLLDGFGQPSGQPCDPQTLNPCVPVLVE